MRPLMFALVACSSAPPSEPSEPVVVLHEDGIENAYPRLSKDNGRILYQSKRSGTWQRARTSARTAGSVTRRKSGVGACGTGTIRPSGKPL